ncbi:MAG: glycosyltransferase family 39 protein [Candidatus Eisenbacteria bacterium]
MMGRLARITLWVISLSSIAAFLWLSALRLMSPIELGNGEGMMLDNAIRVASGQRLYVEPTLRFIPFVYMPLYPVMLAPFINLLGPALWQGRLVDLLSTLGFIAIVIYAIRRETGNLLPGVASAGIFVMGHGLTRGGYDVVRPDPVMLMLAFAGLAILRFSTTPRGAILAGAVSGLAFFAKQHGLLFAFGGMAYLLFHDRRRLMHYTIAVSAVAGGGFLLLSLWLGPWFRFYVHEVPSLWSEFSRGRIRDYFADIVLGKFGALSIPVAMVMAIRYYSGRRGPEWIWHWTAVAGLATGVLSTLDPYAYYHVLMPTIAAFAVSGPVAMYRLGQRLGAGSAVPGAPIPAAVCVVLALQFIPLTYPMRTLLPRPGAQETYVATIKKLRELPGPILMPYHGYYATMAGKGMGMTVLPLDDIIRAKGNSLLKRDPQYFERMFDSLRTGPNRPTIVSDTVFAKAGDASLDLWRSLEGSYRLAGDMGDLIDRLRPLAGARNAPTWIFVPVEPSAADSSRRGAPGRTSGGATSSPTGSPAAR